ncbi:alpha/beta hydrolase fold domain-containing protein [Streptomyces sp. NPDC050448]|uniref:alpha/beta hydrolase fold domain-containing protein n=1 Tax=Streptomyces sp. NPDC050448 TaxID=3155404 RepID=UPI003412CAA8
MTTPAELDVDPARIAVYGESAGGGLAATLALFACDQGRVPVRLQVLMYPMLDDRTATRTDLNPYTGEFIWTPTSNTFGWTSLLGHEPGRIATSLDHDLKAALKQAFTARPRPAVPGSSVRRHMNRIACWSGRRSRRRCRRRSAAG